MTDGRVTHERIQQIRQRLNDATPGPWMVSETNDDHAVIYVDGPADKSATVLFQADWGSINDAQFVANAPTDLQYLLDLTEKQAEENEWLEKVISDHQHGKPIAMNPKRDIQWTVTDAEGKRV